MPGKRKFEDQLAALDALRQPPPEATVEPIRKALANRNNFVVDPKPLEAPDLRS